MKTKHVLALLIASACIVATLTGAKSYPAPLVEVGISYRFTGGGSEVLGKVINNRGGGFYTVENAAGVEYVVNLNQTFCFVEVK